MLKSDRLRKAWHVAPTWLVWKRSRIRASNRLVLRSRTGSAQFRSSPACSISRTNLSPDCGLVTTASGAPHSIAYPDAPKCLRPNLNPENLSKEASIWRARRLTINGQPTVAQKVQTILGSGAGRRHDDPFVSLSAIRHCHEALAACVVEVKRHAWLADRMYLPCCQMDGSAGPRQNLRL